MPGGKFKAGHDPRRNAGGLTKERREQRQTIAEKLDTAFTQPDGTDDLVSAIVLGAKNGDGVCIKLASEYRWGKAPLAITGADGGPIQVAARGMSDAELAAEAARILAEKSSE